MSEKHRDECRKCRMERFWCLCSAARVLGQGFPSRGRRCLGGAHLLTVLAHVGEDLRECAHGVELIHVHPGLLGQVCIHILVADGRHLPNVRIIPARMNGEERGWSSACGAEGRGILPALSGLAVCLSLSSGPGDCCGCSLIWAAGSDQESPLQLWMQEAQRHGCGEWTDTIRECTGVGPGERRGCFFALVLLPLRSNMSLMPTGTPLHTLRGPFMGPKGSSKQLLCLDVLPSWG